MKLIILLLLIGLASCREKSAEKKIVVYVDEEQLAESIVKSIVGGSAQFSELAPTSHTNAFAEVPKIEDLVDSESSHNIRSFILNLNEEKLTQAIYEGMIQATQNVKIDVELDARLEPLPKAEPQRQPTFIVLEVTSENQLYGEREGQRVLLAENISQDDLSATKKWLKVSASQNPQLRLRSSRDSTYSQTQTVIKMAAEEGIDQVIFLSTPDNRYP